ncbi:MAG: aminobenzoyl-glutamate transporter [Marinilabiliales bacterium]|nr:MAG: aminobenzoyl-glutamate transporter [Marinilabiliales bacterium]
MTKKKQSIFAKFLNLTEKVGNALPHPATLFALFALSVLVISLIASKLGLTAIHPTTSRLIEPVNLLNHDGIHRIMLEMVNNFTSFAPLGIVIVAMLGIGVAESSGLIAAAIRLLVINSPKKYLTFVLVFAGIISNTASDIGYVLLIPLAGTIFLSIGRNPLVGMAAAFAGVSGGFSANLILGTIDPLLAGLSQEAAQIIDPSYEVNPTANYYFMVVSTFVVAIVGTWVTEKIVSPRLGEYHGNVKAEAIEKLSKDEKSGLRWSLIVFVVLTALVLIGLIPENGFLRAADGTILNSPVIKGVIALLLIYSAAMGIAYGIASGKFKNDSDVVDGMSDSLKTLATYIVLVFFAAQFVAYFKWSNLGEIIAINGAIFLESINIGSIPLIIAFVILAATINMAMGSASAKWAILAPVFIPLFMELGYSPELSQVVYRIGDSVTNLISPMMSFFALIIAFFQKYDKNASIGTIISTMIPYTFAFFIFWTILIIVWMQFGLPLGPGAPLHYNP